MKNKNQIASLEIMTKESFLNRPNQSTEAIEEYIENLSEENESFALNLKDKLKDNNYLEKFKVAITQTSLMVFLLSIKSAQETLELDSNIKNDINQVITEINIDLEQYIREFLFFARQDDKEIYDMRIFYFNGLTGSELGIGDLLNEDDYDSKIEFELAIKKSKNQMQKYDELLNDLKKQYLDSKLHLK